MIEIYTANPQVRTRFAQIAGQRSAAVRRALNAEAVDSLELETGVSYVPPLMQFFKSRERRSR